MTSLEITLLTREIGAEIRGVDLAGELTDETIASIRAAWLEHLVVFFPDQELTPETQVAFARRFGEITEGHPVEPSLPEHPNVLPIGSAKDRVDFWHTDVTFMRKPPAGSLLYALELPVVGGDTLWTTTRVAYDTLPPSLRRCCDELTAIHFDPHDARVVADGGGKTWDGRQIERLLPVTHPVVRVHPETGRSNLFVNPKFTVGLEGFPGSLGERFLGLLYDHMTQPPVRDSLPVATAHARPVGQPRDDALRSLRLRGIAADHASGDAARRPPNRTTAQRFLTRCTERPLE